MRFTLSRIAKELNGDATTTIRVAKAWCSPSRSALTGALTPLHIWFDAPAYDKYAKVDPATGAPAYQWADIVVKRKQAAWAEYVILSIKTPQGAPVFQILSRPQNPKNAAWAARRRGVPTPWDLQRGTADVAWIEHDCPESKALGTRNAQGKTAANKNYGGVIFTSERAPRPSRPARRTRTRRKRR